MINGEATKAYKETQVEIEKQIEKLRQRLIAHSKKGLITWASVGDMNHVLSQLKQLNRE